MGVLLSLQVAEAGVNGGGASVGLVEIVVELADDDRFKSRKIFLCLGERFLGRGNVLRLKRGARAIEIRLQALLRVAVVLCDLQGVKGRAHTGGTGRCLLDVVFKL